MKKWINTIISFKGTALFLTTTLLLALTGCGGEGPSETNLVTVDVTADYPEKEVVLQELFDVEYIPLETTEEFVTMGYVAAVSESYILTSNGWIRGELYLFDRKTGKGICVINHMGESGEEYLHIDNCLLDEPNKELFVYDRFKAKMLVYDLNGRFKRRFDYPKNNILVWSNYDDEHLLCYMNLSERLFKEEHHIQLISKQDGSVCHEFLFPFEGDSITLAHWDEYGSYSEEINLVAPTSDGWFVVYPSSDTLYHISKDKKMTPFFVRKPPVHETNPPMFLAPHAVTDRYVFLTVVERKTDDRGARFPRKGLLYDKMDGMLSRYIIRDTSRLGFKSSLWEFSPSDYPLASSTTLDANYLIGLYQSGTLQGRLKEIASHLEEEDNSVIMLLKHKQ